MRFISIPNFPQFSPGIYWTDEKTNADKTECSKHFTWPYGGPAGGGGGSPGRLLVRRLTLVPERDGFEVFVFVFVVVFAAAVTFVLTVFVC